MNFIKAIQHATIGYGIRRKVWAEKLSCYLFLHSSGELHWAEGNVCEWSRLCPTTQGDIAIDLFPEDIAAIDWETV